MRHCRADFSELPFDFLREPRQIGRVSYNCAMLAGGRKLVRSAERLVPTESPGQGRLSGHGDRNRQKHHDCRARQNPGRVHAEWRRDRWVSAVGQQPGDCLGRREHRVDLQADPLADRGEDQASLADERSGARGGRRHRYQCGVQRQHDRHITLRYRPSTTACTPATMPSASTIRQRSRSCGR